MGVSYEPGSPVLRRSCLQVRWVKFTFDSKRLISGGDDSFIILWSTPETLLIFDHDMFYHGPQMVHRHEA